MATYFWNINIPRTTAKEMRSVEIHIKQYSSGVWKDTSAIETHTPLDGARELIEIILS